MNSQLHVVSHAPLQCICWEKLSPGRGRKLKQPQAIHLLSGNTTLWSLFLAKPSLLSETVIMKSPNLYLEQ